MVHLLLVFIYLAFISLGLPDALLGSAWPSMYMELGVPVSYAGILSMIIAVGTVISSLMSDRMTKWLGTSKVTAISVAMTATALLGFSFSNAFWMLCLFAIPYGLGAGSVDAALNNYVALHYSSRHMSWLHCMWGVGTIVGPTIMGFALTGGQTWNDGYRYAALIQMVITAILVWSFPLWKGKTGGTRESEEPPAKPLTLRETVQTSGAWEVMITFFCYCAAEATAMLWASSYLTLHNGIAEETAAGLASLFYIGITAGRLVSGFLTVKFTDTQMIRIGQGILVTGAAMMLMPFGAITSMIGIILFGLGCAPIYPCIIHSTPVRFGAEKSQAMIGVQMASAYVGTCLMPPLFGFIANHVHVGLLPIYLLSFAGLMIFMHERLVRMTEGKYVC